MSGTEGIPAVHRGKDVNAMVTRPRPTGRSYSGVGFRLAARIGPAAVLPYQAVPG
jgi:hypothetical protein